MGKRTRPRPPPPSSSTSGFDAVAGDASGGGAILVTTGASSSSKAAREADDDTSTRSSASSGSGGGGGDGNGEGISPLRRPPIPFWPALVPATLFCFQLFGFQPVLTQLLNKLECTRLGASDCDSKEVNGGAALLMKYVLALEFSCATLSLGTVGALCDYVGRKPAMFMTTVGQVFNLVMVLSALSCSFKAAMVRILVGTAVNGLVGAYGTYLTGIYAYAADLTKADPASRGRLFGLILGAIAIGNTLGPLATGLALNATGSYAVPLVMQLVLCLLILALLLWWVQESLDPGDKPREPFNLCRTHNTAAVLYQFLLTYRHESHRAGAGRGRAGGVPPLLPLSIVFCLCFSDLVGQGTIFINYAKLVFRWSPDTLGYYESAIGLSKGLVMLVLLPLVYSGLLKRGQKPNDYLFATVGIALGMVYFLMLALLPYPAAAFAAIPFSGLSQGAYPHLRSLFSNSVAQAAQGQLFGFMSAMETLMTAVTPLVLNTVYTATVKSYPGFVWLILFAYLVLAQAALYWAWYLARKEKGEEGGLLAEALLLSKGEGDEEAGSGGGNGVGS